MPFSPKCFSQRHSRGGRIAHRFALSNPEQVLAVAPIAAGTWTTPDGRFLVEGLGEVPNARAFLSNAANESRVPTNLRDLFDHQLRQSRRSKAVAGAREIPFLVMCGTLDRRLPQAKEFVRSLEASGYQVEAEWPRTPHACDDMRCWKEYESEFLRVLSPSRRVLSAHFSETMTSARTGPLRTV